MQSSFDYGQVWLTVFNIPSEHWTTINSYIQQYFLITGEELICSWAIQKHFHPCLMRAPPLATQALILFLKFWMTLSHIVLGICRTCSQITAFMSRILLDCFYMNHPWDSSKEKKSGGVKSGGWGAHLTAHFLLMGFSLKWFLNQLRLKLEVGTREGRERRGGERGRGCSDGPALPLRGESWRMQSRLNQVNQNIR